MLKLFISGATGAMGKNLVHLAQDIPHQNIIGGLGQLTNDSFAFPLYDSIIDVPPTMDCIIDFSNASLTDALLDYCLVHKKPLVLCTTGLSTETLDRVQEVSKVVPLFKSGNMSLGINLLSKLLEVATQILGDHYDIEIIEKHHNRKLDAPSGTALMLAETIAHNADTPKSIVLGRPALGAKAPHEINIHAVRGGSIVGEHEVLFAGEDETITLSHGAYSRRVFATGALEAADFLVLMPPGLYDMDDLITYKIKDNEGLKKG